MPCLHGPFKPTPVPRAASVTENPSSKTRLIRIGMMGSSLASGMVLAVQFLEPLAGDVGVDLRRTEVTVAQQQLHDS